MKSKKTKKERVNKEEKRERNLRCGTQRNCLETSKIGNRNKKTLFWEENERIIHSGVIISKLIDIGICFIELVCIAKISFSFVST